MARGGFLLGGASKALEEALVLCIAGFEAAARRFGAFLAANYRFSSSDRGAKV